MFESLTLDKLQRRGWSLANRCILCGKEEDTGDHILLHYELTRAVWDLLLSLFGLYWVLPSTVKEVFISWLGSFVGKTRLKVWGAAPIFLDNMA